MRTPEQISKIKENFDNPKTIKKFLDDTDIDHLINVYKKDCSSNGPYTNVVRKNTGPVTLDLHHYFEDPVVKKILTNLRSCLGNYTITAAFFFKTDYPHIIHNDDTFELPDTVFKGITLPLELEGFNGIYPKLCFFDQHYFHGPAKFFNGDKDIPTYYNKQIYEYSNVDNLVEDKFIDSEKYFSHLKPQWLEGLSLQTTINWIPGDAIIFDSVQLHCASDFRNLGIKTKLGISIFTKKD